jgi:predicted O-methyltransferase YrrM
MNTVIEAIYATGECVGPQGAKYAVYPAGIKRPEGEALYKLVRDLDARRTLEVGMAWGLATLFFCQAHKDAGHAMPAHTAIDPFQTQSFHGMGRHNVRAAGLGEMLTFLEESSHSALPRMAAEGRQFDLVFVDGSHLFDAAVVDFFFADRLIPVGGHLVFDDLWLPSVRKLLGFVLANRAYRIAEERLPARTDLKAAKEADRAYQERKKRGGKLDHGTQKEAAFHLYRNINWTVLQKTGGDERFWDHFAAF